MPVAKKLGFDPKTFPTFKTADRRVYSTSDSPLGSRVMTEMFAGLRDDRREEWKQILSDFEENPDFFNSHRYLNHHPLFYRFAFPSTAQRRIHERFLESDNGLDSRNVSIMVFKVNPETNSADNEFPEKNTRIRVYCEAGPTYWKDRDGTVLDYIAQSTLDPDLCLHADSYEQLIVKLALQVHHRYGNDRTKIMF